MIDPGLIKYLDTETQTRLRAFETMFDSAGWKLTYEFLKHQYDQTKLAVLTATSWEDNRLHMGRLSILGDMLRLQESTAAEFEAMALDRQEGEAEEVIEGELEYE